MRIVGVEEMQTGLLNVLNNAHRYGTDVQSIIILLYNYGLRVSEAVNIKGIILNVVNNDVTIRCPKTGHLRVIVKDTSTTNAIDHMLQYQPDDPPQSVEQVRLICKKFLTFYPCTIGEKRVDTHLFRHLTCKKLMMNGLSTQQIATYMGIGTQTAGRYINSIVVAE